MGRRSLTPDSFFNPEFVHPGCLEPGTVPWLLARHRSTILPRWLFVGWRGESRLGRPAWPAVVLMTLILLRFGESTHRSEPMSRRHSCRRADKDAEWRAAMGLNFGVQPPDEKTVREIEAFLRERHPDAGIPRILLLHEHVVRLCQAHVLGDDPLWVTDSTPMWCYGAVVDTVRLLGEGIEQVVCQWADGTRSTVEQVARQWDTPWVGAPSVKGAFDIDWSDEDERADILTTLGEKTLEIVELVRRRLTDVRKGKRKKLLKLCRNLLRVVEQNLEPDEDGRLTIARRVAVDRIISMTDPEARHGHKSRNNKFDGFKLHVLGDAVSGLILSLAVTPANTHDSAPALRLIKRAKRLQNDLETLLADTAYGAAMLRHHARTLHDVCVIAPPAGASPSEDGLSKADFGLELVRGVAICPDGVVTTDIKWVKRGAGEKAPRALWPKDHCEDCPHADACPAVRKVGNSRVIFHPYENELQMLREEWSWPETREMYRRRTEGERLVSEAVRRGARKAMAWGLQSAELQAYVIIIANNLSLLAEQLARNDVALSAA